MADKKIRFSVFTKPWRTMPLARLGQFVSDLGFDGIEFPLRPGYQVEPDNLENLPAAAKQLADYNVKIFSVAGPSGEATIAACAEAGIPVIRIAASLLSREESYLAAEARYQREFDTLVPLLDKYGVKLGVQTHSGWQVGTNAVGLRRLIEKYDPKHIAAIWDAAHEALSGMMPEMAIDVVWSHLCQVNLKNGFWQRTTGPEAEHAQWQLHWTSGRQGLASWPRVAEELKVRSYQGVICLHAEYSDADSVNRLISQDVAYAKSVFQDDVPAGLLEKARDHKRFGF